MSGCSPSVILPSATVSWRGVHSSGDLVFVAAAQGRTLDHLALVASRSVLLGPTGLYLERRFLAGYHPQGTAQTAN